MEKIVMWKIVKEGGSIGEIIGRRESKEPVKKYATREEAKADAKWWKSLYSKEARKYYGVKYRVVKCGAND